jgi:TolB-like protein/DNA-binding winged helix-turn-helix (wHTH) protein/tetratricopeptide (TPR) repeat protein
VRRLQEKPLLLLLALLESPGRVIAHHELRARLWPTETHLGFDDSLKHAVMRLREALGDSAEAPRYVETVPRRGYRFIGPVERAEGSSSGRSWHGRHRAAKVALILVAAAILALATQWARTRIRAGESLGISSVAVLPLKNFSGDSEQEYLADGLTEALISELAREVPFKVVSRTSTMTYKESRKTLPEIAHELGVEGVVEGGVALADGRARITVQLIDAATDRHLWSGSFDREVTDVLALQMEVARAVAAELGVRMTARAPSSRRVVPEAHRQYVVGRHFYGRWPVGLDEAVTHFERAAALDPDFAEAYGSLAMSLQDRAFTSRPAAEALAESERAAKRALAIDDRVAEAWAALAGVKMLRDWDWSGAEAALRRAVALDPASSEVRMWYSNLLTALGRFEAGLEEARRARDQDPVSVQMNRNLAWTLAKARRYEEAITEYQKALELDPSVSFTRQGLAWVYCFQGRYAEALAEFERAGVSEHDPHRAYALAASGQRARALEAVRRLEADGADSYFVAMPYAGLGDEEPALRWLGRALDERAPTLYLLKIDPWWDGLRDEPRFQNYLHRMGLDAGSES